MKKQCVLDENWDETMELLHNIRPVIRFPFAAADHAFAINLGCSGHIGAGEGYAVLLFQDVEDHVDGNGWVALWLVHGEGTFHQGDASRKLRNGDIILFDDRIEHGFSAESLCVGINFSLDRPDERESLLSRIKTLNVAPVSGPTGASLGCAINMQAGRIGQKIREDEYVG